MIFHRFGLIFHRNFSSKAVLRNVEIEKIRNIGILAHIDAGKTTTTERMLYYSGLISHMGEVHHGNTVTDFMDQERERGITITSASVSFHWRNHRFNLIDTPGHIDFTMEVEQTLSVLDGAVVILDSSAGVEAQTLTVWRQMDRYNLPRIIFLNKMDRNDANIDMCLESVRKKLNITPILLQLPFKENNKLNGLVDVLSKTKLLFTEREFQTTPLTQNDKLYDFTVDSRAQIVDKLSEFNEDLAEKIISQNSIDNIETNQIVTALREETFNRKIVPVVIGSAYKNIGVQPLMDSIILYLPSPISISKRELFGSFSGDLCARSFKIRHCKQRGTLVFLRIFNGTLSKGQRIYSVGQNKNEVVQRVYSAFADDLHEVETVSNGNIAVVAGLKHCKIGDLITSTATSYAKAMERLKHSNKNVFGLDVKVPEPVFFCSVEPESAAYQTALENALIELQREDPSFSVTQNAETGQTILGGMGELHMEIIKDRLLRNYKVKAALGQLQINYLEALKGASESKQTFEFHTRIGSSEQRFTITLSAYPTKHCDDEDVLVFDKTTEGAKNISAIHQRHLNAIRNGVETALRHGPKLGCKVANVHVMLHNFNVSKSTSDTVISAGVTQFVHKLVAEIGTDVLEPVMRMEIVTPSDYLSAILADLSRRRAAISEISHQGEMKVAYCETPLSELMGYSTILRTISSGTATFSMELSEFKRMSAVEEEGAISSVRGF